jgi:hypothetical protein
MNCDPLVGWLVGCGLVVGRNAGFGALFADFGYLVFAQASEFLRATSDDDGKVRVIHSVAILWGFSMRLC